MGARRRPKRLRFRQQPAVDIVTSKLLLSEKLVAYLDDIYILVPTDIVPGAMQTTKGLADKYRLKLNVAKTEMSTWLSDK